MTLYLVRHTKVDCKPGICYGQSDLDVYNTFEEEKDIIISKLQDITFNKIYSSPLKRCSILTESLTNMRVNYDKRLMELDFGKWEGKVWSDIEKTQEAKLWFKDYLNTPCPNGESYNDLLKRVESFINDLKKDDKDDNLLIVCHGGTLRAFHTLINKANPQKAFNLKIEYGQIIKFSINNE